MGLSSHSPGQPCLALGSPQAQCLIGVVLSLITLFPHSGIWLLPTNNSFVPFLPFSSKQLWHADLLAHTCVPAGKVSLPSQGSTAHQCSLLD